jgi:SEC-C motif-containing protein
MRSRYSAYVLGDESYLLATWHASTRPSQLNLAEEGPVKWLGLKVINANDDQIYNEGTVEFVARYKVNGKAYRLHELSRFVRENGVWFYVDGEIKT